MRLFKKARLDTDKIAFEKGLAAQKFKIAKTNWEVAEKNLKTYKALEFQLRKIKEVAWCDYETKCRTNYFKPD